MILKQHDKVPIADVLPAIVSILPLKNDYEENEPLYKMIVQLCKSLFTCLILLYANIPYRQMGGSYRASTYSRPSCPMTTN